MILGAALCFALMNFFVNAAGDLPVMQKVFFRNLVAAFIAAVCLCFEKEKFRIHDKSCLLWLFLRAAVGFLGVVLNFYAIDHLNSISDASILNKLSPFFAILFSVFLLGEKPRALELLFVFVAFGGAVLVASPTFSMDVLPALAGIGGGACAGFAYTCVRVLGCKGERSNMTVFFFSAFSTLAALPFFIANYAPMSAMQLSFLLLSGVAAAGGQFFITAAYRFAPAKEISVFDYAQVPFAALLGFFFLHQIPKPLSLAGYAVIIAAAVARWAYGLLRDRRERKGNAETSSPASPASDPAPSPPPDASPPPPAQKDDEKQSNRR